MVDWNPSYPELVGLEWWPNQRQTARIFANSPGRLMRVTSTLDETIESLEMSATIDPLLRADTYTVIDVFEEGDETDIPDFSAQELLPNGDDGIEDWTTGSLLTSNLYQHINESATRWPGPAQYDWIETTNSTQTYRCSVDSSEFDTGGDLENARIGFVEVRAIFGANTGYRKLRSGIQIGSTQYAPAGGTLQNVHGFGAMRTMWYGELNPATELPWTPADIADFDTGGTSRLYVKSEAATANHIPRCYALRLFVYCVPEENRAAVGIYRRSEDLTTTQVHAATDNLITLPAGTADWAKETGKNYTFFWRQSVCPALYGPVNADDVRWNGAYQDLGPRGVPGGKVYPLTTSDEAPDEGFGSASASYDYNGKPLPESGTMELNSQAAYGVVMIDDNGDPSVDSQPYRTDLDVLVPLYTGSNSASQRFTMPSTQSYLGVRFPIVPPATGDGNLVVAVHRVSTGAQVGGSFITTAADVRARAEAPNGWRYVSGFLASAASLTSGVQYEVRFSTGTAGTWYLLAPDSSLAPEVGFGGTTDTFASAGVAQTDRDLCVVLTKQPDPPTGLTVAIETVAVAMPDESTRDVEHVGISWTAPAVPLAGQFSRYELERRIDGEDDWARAANITNPAVVSFVDHLAQRQIESFYRIRVVGKNGQFSAWAESAGITPSDGDYDILLTSNHYPDLEVVLDQNTESSFTFRNNESNEIIQLHGADYQVVFTEDEDRGVSWTFTADVNFGDAPPPGRGGARAFDALRSIVDSKGVIPYVAVLDFFGAKTFAHLTLTNATQSSPGNVYKVTVEVIPTYAEEVPPEVSE